ncbi:MAG: GNAT family N-acetyltransferase [Candidatus Omnitrophota bacterium]
MIKTANLRDVLQALPRPAADKNLFSSPDWLTVIEKTYHIRLRIKYIERHDAIASYIIYSVVKNFLEWKICICSYCDYFDCQVVNLEDWKALFHSLREDFPEYRIAIRNLRDEIVRQIPELTILSKERFHILDVREPLPEIWKRTHDSFRSAVKQAQKNGVVVKRCAKEGLRDFYQLHFKLRKNKYRLFAQPYCFFDIIWRQYVDKGQGALLGAYDADGRFIGGNMYLICGDTLYYKFNTSSRDALQLRPNNLMFWEGIKFAKERNLRYLDLGSSGCEQHGLIMFKNHAGAMMSDITHLGYAPQGYRFSQKKILKWMTRTFTEPWMPDFMTRLGSRIIYPFLA